jgi:carbonic anhydrase
MPSARALSTLIVVGAAMAAPSAQQPRFEYFGPNGPSHWGSLDPAWAACGDGREQSPIAFGPLTAWTWQGRTLDVEYGPTHGEIFNNGHTIEVETEGNNHLALDGERFELVQFHFHSPSEHVLLGQGADMELHLVHRSETGRLAVLGVLLHRGPTSGALSPILDEMPDDVGVHHELESAFDPARFLPRLRTHLRYAGSLTTPPCSEGVRWFVFTQAGTVSDEHMAQFNERVRFNARPVQRRTR